MIGSNVTCWLWILADPVPLLPPLPLLVINMDFMPFLRALSSPSIMSPIRMLTKAYSINEKKTKTVQPDMNTSIACPRSRAQIGQQIISISWEDQKNILNVIDRFFSYHLSNVKTQWDARATRAIWYLPSLSFMTRQLYQHQKVRLLKKKKSRSGGTTEFDTWVPRVDDLSLPLRLIMHIYSSQRFL